MGWNHQLVELLVEGATTTALPTHPVALEAPHQLVAYTEAGGWEWWVIRFIQVPKNRREKVVGEISYTGGGVL